MVRPLTDRPAGATGAWKALLAIGVVAGGLLWHVLACTESPMAFSPSGEHLAFVTMEPYGDDKLGLAGTHVYRLMVLSSGRELRTVEETHDCLLSAPAYSPDGKYLAYLRIPLYTVGAAEKFKQMFEQRKNRLEELLEVSDRPAPVAVARPDEPAPQDLEGVEDLSIPSVGKLADLDRHMIVHPPLPAVLVIREAPAGRVVSLTRVDLPIDEMQGDTFLMAYLTIRPQFSLDGQWVYLCVNNVLKAVSPSERKERIVAAPAAMAAPSPDGATVATVHEEIVGFLQADGALAVYRRMETEGVSLSGLAWVDKETVALLRPDTRRIDLLRTDGTIRPALTLPEIPKPDKTMTGELAVAPDGKRLCVSYGHDVLFLDRGGKVLRHWHSDDELLVQPTFAPDGKRIALKHMMKLLKEKATEKSRVDAIVFYSPDGKELSRVDVPAARLPEPPAEVPTAPATPAAMP